MCLITLSWQPAQETPLTVVANRDEFYARPALALHDWADRPMLAGKDVQAGGTWLGLGWGQLPGAQTLRFAALTNYRHGGQHNPSAPSRGNITTAFLSGSMSAATYLEALKPTASLYNPYNLVVCDGHELMAFESRHARAFALPPGVTSVSNADFNTPWPKLMRLHLGVQQALGRQNLEMSKLALPKSDAALASTFFDMLADTQTASDEQLPKTGLHLDKERMLSAAFICTPDYGTRASSVLRLKRRSASFIERSFNAAGFTGQVRRDVVLGKAWQVKY